MSKYDRAQKQSVKEIAAKQAQQAQKDKEATIRLWEKHWQPEHWSSLSLPEQTELWETFFRQTIKLQELVLKEGSLKEPLYQALKDTSNKSGGLSLCVIGKMPVLSYIQMHKEAFKEICAQDFLKLEDIPDWPRLKEEWDVRATRSDLYLSSNSSGETPAPGSAAWWIFVMEVNARPSISSLLNVTSIDSFFDQPSWREGLKLALEEGFKLVSEKLKGQQPITVSELEKHTKAFSYITPRENLYQERSQKLWKLWEDYEKKKKKRVAWLDSCEAAFRQDHHDLLVVLIQNMKSMDPDLWKSEHHLVQKACLHGASDCVMSLLQLGAKTEVSPKADWSSVNALLNLVHQAYEERALQGVETDKQRAAEKAIKLWSQRALEELIVQGMEGEDANQMLEQWIKKGLNKYPKKGPSLARVEAFMLQLTVNLHQAKLKAADSLRLGGAVQGEVPSQGVPAREGHDDSIPLSQRATTEVEAVRPPVRRRL